MTGTPGGAGSRRSAAAAFVVNSLAARAQSVEEIRRKLAAREVPPEVAEAVIADALELRYLDDAELAGQLARGFRSRGYGRRRASAGMRRRALPPDVVEAALDAAFGDADEATLAGAALGSRPVGDAKAERRAVAYLLRRGFSTAAAWQAVRSRADSDGE